MQYGTAAIVRGDGKEVSLSHCGDLLRFGNTAAPGEIGHDDLSRTVFQKLTKSPTSHQPLAQTEGQISRTSQFSVGCQIILRQHLLQPHGLVGFQSCRNLDCARQVPEAVKLHRNVDGVAEFLSYESKRLN